MRLVATQGGWLRGPPNGVLRERGAEAKAQAATAERRSLIVATRLRLVNYEVSAGVRLGRSFSVLGTKDAAEVWRAD